MELRSNLSFNSATPIDFFLGWQGLLLEDNGQK